MIRVWLEIDWIEIKDCSRRDEEMKRSRQIKAGRCGVAVWLSASGTQKSLEVKDCGSYSLLKFGLRMAKPQPKEICLKKDRSQTNCCYKQSTGNSWQANHGKSIGFDRQQIHSSHSNLVTMTCIKSVHQTVHCLSPGIQIKISQAMPALCSCAKLRPSFFSRVCKCWISTSRDKGSAGTLTLTQLLDSPPCLRFSRSRPKGSKRSYYGWRLDHSNIHMQRMSWIVMVHPMIHHTGLLQTSHMNARPSGCQSNLKGLREGWLALSLIL